jgi:hypothetical protein
MVLTYREKRRIVLIRLLQSQAFLLYLLILEAWKPLLRRQSLSYPD